MIYGERPRFRDRTDAGTKLANKLKPYQSEQTVVLAVPGGGVPVAIEIAKSFNAPFDVVVTRKITVPENPEAGYGAVAEDGAMFLNEQLLARLGLSPQQVELQAAQVLAEIERRTTLYRKSLSRVSSEGKTAIIVDDGLASGFTMVAAVESVKRQKPDRIVVASPVASRSAYDTIKPVCDAIVCLVVSSVYPFAVASFYHHWHDLTDDEVTQYLHTWQMQKAKGGGNERLS